jgi:nitroimidazol reductase NimA-like FMN-containing flavoprotein (pyridoxamine 5'-phosphate oxidase superfamily)
MSQRPILDERIRGLLAETTIVRVATVTPKGRPHVAPFWFWCDGERIVISTLRNQTVRNLEANPDVAVLVDLGTDFRDLRGAHIRGRARVHREGQPVPDVVAHAQAEISRIHAAELEEPEFKRYEAWERREAIALEIVPESATWFDLGRAEMGRTGPNAGPLHPVRR